MAKLKINSKKYGIITVFLDNDDYALIEKEFKNLKWCVSKSRNKFYIQKRTDKGLIFLHRFLTNCPVGLYVDHINHNTLDNRKSNLRIVNNADNLRNGCLRANNKSGINGVRYDEKRNKWEAGIKVNYKNIFLGRYKDLKDAIKARLDAENMYWNTTNILVSGKEV